MYRNALQQAKNLRFSDTITTPAGQMEIDFRFGDIAASFWPVRKALDEARENGDDEQRHDALARLWEMLLPLYPLCNEQQRDADVLEWFERYVAAKIVPFMLAACSAYVYEGRLSWSFGRAKGWRALRSRILLAVYRAKAERIGGCKE